MGLGLAIGSATVALAESPVDLGGTYVYDSTGVVSGQETRIKSALDDLFNKTGIKLYVVYVDSFTGSSQWADDTANLNGFGNDDVLLAIATGTRNYEVSYPSDFALSQSKTDQIEAEDLVPNLRSSDWAEAAVSFAKGLSGTKSSGSTGSSSPGAFPWLPVGAVALVGGGGAYLYVRSRKKKAAGTAKASQQDLDRQAGGLLVSLDDAISTSEQELGFAVAQFGDKATEQFSKVLADAKDKIGQAFKIRQKLDDSIPETPEEKRTLTLQIIELCTQASESLSSQTKDFDDLRQLEKDIPGALENAGSALEKVKGDLVTVKTKVSSLKSKYSASALNAIADNPDQVSKLIDFAQSSIDAGSKANGEGDGATAAVSVRNAQQSIGQAVQLVSAVDKLSGELSDASSKLDQAIAQLKADVAEASALPDTSGSLKGATAAAQSAIQSADGSDPVAQLSNLQSSAAELDKSLGVARSEQDRVHRAKSALDSAISAAGAKISTANDYITTRRGGVRDSARTRLYEARRHLDSAVGMISTDPVSALSEAQTASSLADQALQTAQSDVNVWTQQSGSDSSILGPLLGGLIGGSIGGQISRGRSTGWSAGSSSRAGGYSGGYSGSFGGGFGGAPSRRASGSGNFGSGSRGGRRSSGGRF